MIFSLVFLFLLFPSSPFSLAYSFFFFFTFIHSFILSVFCFFLVFSLYLSLSFFFLFFFSLFFLIFPSFSLSLFFLLFFFVSFFGRVRSFYRFPPVISAAVFHDAFLDASASLNQFNFEFFAVKLKQTAVMFPFTHAAYLHVVDHVPGNPGFGRHRF